MKLSEELVELAEWWLTPSCSDDLLHSGANHQMFVKYSYEKYHMAHIFDDKAAKHTATAYLCLLEAELQKEEEAEMEAHKDMLDCEVDG